MSKKHLHLYRTVIDLNPNPHFLIADYTTSPSACHVRAAALCDVMRKSDKFEWRRVFLFCSFNSIRFQQQLQMRQQQQQQLQPSQQQQQVMGAMRGAGQPPPRQGFGTLRRRILVTVAI